MQLDLFEVSYQQQLLEMIPNEKRIFGDIEVVYEGEKEYLIGGIRITSGLLIGMGNYFL